MSEAPTYGDLVRTIRMLCKDSSLKSKAKARKVAQAAENRLEEQVKRYGWKKEIENGYK